MNNWYNYDFKTTAETREILYDCYFDLDLIKIEKEEVFVDLGAYTGDTILSFIENYGEDSYKKIYCYEITPDTFGILKEKLKDYKNIDCRLKGVSNKEEILYFDNKEGITSANSLDKEGNIKVETVTLDNDIKEKITMIKADIEGFEQQAIEGAQKHILNDHPKLMLSVYHKNEDLWKIARMIYNISDKYQFYLRYNSSPVYPTEITLIAI